jgi:hypothetical protein
MGRKCEVVDLPNQYSQAHISYSQALLNLEKRRYLLLFDRGHAAEAGIDPKSYRPRNHRSLLFVVQENSG